MGSVGLKGGNADNSTEMVNVRDIATAEVRNGKPKVELEGRNLTILTHPQKQGMR